MALSRPRIHENFGHITVLRNRVAQAIELVACLYIVGTAPAALEECDVFVELVVLIGVTNSERIQIGRGLCALARLQGCGQCCTRIVDRSYAVNVPNQIGRRSLPSEVVIVGEEVAESGGSDYLRSQRNVGAKIVG